MRKVSGYNSFLFFMHLLTQKRENDGEKDKMGGRKLIMVKIQTTEV